MPEPTKHEISYDAGDKKTGLTLEELGWFVQNALRNDFPPTSTIRVSTGWTAQVRTISIANTPGDTK